MNNTFDLIERIEGKMSRFTAFDRESQDRMDAYEYILEYIEDNRVYDLGKLCNDLAYKMQTNRTKTAIAGLTYCSLGEGRTKVFIDVVRWIQATLNNQRDDKRSLHLRF